MYAADFRAAARRALSGKWFLAVAAGLIAALLDGAHFNAPRLELKFQVREGLHFEIGSVDLTSLVGLNIPSRMTAWIFTNAVLVLVSAIIIGAVLFAIGSVVSTGYARFNLALIDGEEPRLADLFEPFPRFKTLFCARFLVLLYTLLWTLLLIIPGIIASLSYAMTPYLLAEHPELTAGEAIRRSKELMEGNRWRLFCLGFSFIGWAFLCVVTFGLGSLWLTPYAEAAYAAFYRDLTAVPAPGASAEP